MKTISMKIIIFIFCILIVFISFFYVEKSDYKDNPDNTIRNINYSSLSVESKQMKNVSDNNVHKSEVKTSDTIYAQKDVVEAIPSLDDSGLIKLIKNNFRYPSNIKPINGKISADLVIERDGSISDVIIVKGLHPELDKEAKRVLKLMPKFTPGKKEGHPVRSKYRTFVYSFAKE